MLFRSPSPFLPDYTSSSSDEYDGGYFAPKFERRRLSDISGISGSESSSDEWSILRTELGNGGLRNAVEASEDAAEMVYVGTLGYGTDKLDDSTKVAIEGRLREEHNCLVAFTSEADFDGHYNHYCKEVCLLVHSMSQFLTDLDSMASLPLFDPGPS